MRGHRDKHFGSSESANIGLGQTSCSCGSLILFKNDFTNFIEFKFFYFSLFISIIKISI